jgi:predicted enzyme related to lactoylglutathione lyase
MIRKISHVSLTVKDQYEAARWYQEKLDWVIKRDEPFPGNPENRWVTIAPAGQTELEVILELPEWGMASATSQGETVGRAPGFTLETDDCRGDYERFKARGVQFMDEPAELPWGISCVFADLYGHLHNLLQPHRE